MKNELEKEKKTFQALLNNVPLNLPEDNTGVHPGGEVACWTNSPIVILVLFDNPRI